MFLGVDIGTYEAKGVVIDRDGTRLATASRRHEPSIPRSGYLEHDSEEVWWIGFKEIVAELSTQIDLGAIEAVGCSGIGPCVLPLDVDRNPLRPAILYGVDTRASAQCDSLKTELGEAEIFRRCGNALTSQSAGPKILWLKENEPGVFASTDLIVTCQGFLVGRLTGEWVMDHATAAYFHPLYELDSNTWIAEHLEAVGARGILPPLRWSTDVAGFITPAAAAETGLPKDIPVTVGTADAPAEALSCGVAEPGDVMIMHGSSIFIIAVTDQDLRSSRLWAAPFLFEGSSILAAGTATAGTATRWWLQVSGASRSELNVSDHELFGRASAGAALVAPGSRGLTFLPHFSGERTPFNDPDARGAVVGLDLTHTADDIFRALIDGIAIGIRWNLEAIGELYDGIERLRSVGGGTKNEVWMQAVADATGMRHETVGASACVGSALMAGLAVGAFDRDELRAMANVDREVVPEPQRRLVYDDLADSAKRIYEALRGART